MRIIDKKEIAYQIIDYFEEAYKNNYNLSNRVFDIMKILNDFENNVTEEVREDCQNDFDELKERMEEVLNEY